MAGERELDSKETVTEQADTEYSVRIICLSATGRVSGNLGVLSSRLKRLSRFFKTKNECIAKNEKCH